MKERILSILLAAVLAASVLSIPASALNDGEQALFDEYAETLLIEEEEQFENITAIYLYLADLRLNNAAISGILANIWGDSEFYPETSIYGVTSIGILQWCDDYCEEEIDWCIDEGYDPYSLEGQLAYLGWQLQNEFLSVYTYLYGIEDNEDGAYEAGFYFYQYFDSIVNTNTLTRATTRGNRAADRYYPFVQALSELSEYSVTVSGQDDADDADAENSADSDAEDDSDTEEDGIDYSAVSLPFTDVAAGSWYYEYIAYAYANGMVNGVTLTTFEPESSMSRAAVVQILYNMNGTPDIRYGPYFEDVTRDAWYASAVVWAKENGIVNGTSDTTFEPEREITREEMAQILYNYYVEYRGESANGLKSLKSFPDYEDVTFGKTALQWAVGNGIVNGVDAGGTNTLNPLDSCTRAEGTTMLVRFVRTFG